MFAIVLFSSSTLSSELEWSFLQGAGGLDMSTLEELFSNKYIPGKYLVDVEFNRQSVGKRLLTITEEDKKEGLCLSESWLSDSGLPINTDYFIEEYNVDRDCYLLENNQYGQVEFDFSTQSLSITLPQKGLLKETKIYEWDYGIPAVRMNYNANLSMNDVGTTGYGSAGIVTNLGKWVGNGSMSVTDKGAELQVANASRALYGLKSDLTIGKTYAGGALAGGAGMVGISLKNNRSMLPNNLGYTPVFSGVANSNARVTLIQNGRTIYSELVPPGPFEINNVGLLSSGDVTMRIAENNGDITEQLYPLSIAPNLLSPSEVDYGVYAGLRDGNELNGVFVGGQLAYGMESWTLRGEGLLHKKYASLGAGVTIGFGEWGVIGLESAYSHAQYDDDSVQSGSKFSATYSKTLSRDTDIQVRTSQYGNGYFTPFSSFTPQKSESSSKNALDAQYDLSLNHRLSSRWNTSLSTSRRAYRGDSDDITTVNGFLSVQFDWLSTSLGLSMAQRGEERDYRSSLSVSVPFNAFDRKISSSALVSRSQNGDMAYSTGVSTSLSDRLIASATVSGNNTGGGEMYTLRTNYSGEKASLAGHLSQRNGSTTGSASISGSVIGLPTENDILITKGSSGTLIIANVEQIEGVKFRSSVSSSNAKGNAVIPASGYRENSVILEGALPMNVELLETQKKIVPADRSVVYLPFKALKVKRYLFQIMDSQGDFVPAGTWAISDMGTPLGFVSQNGILFVNTLDELSDFVVGACKVASSSFVDTRELQEVKCEE
nr:fimbria/pilus outer membrane usher protein [Vibrio parahaemolyticus]